MNIVNFIVDNSTIAGLTEKVENYIKGLGMDVNSVEIVNEDTDKEESN